MTYEEAQQLALKVRWKTVTCLAGEECWCRIVVPEKDILYGDDNDEEFYIAASGALPTMFAEDMVKNHNDSLKPKFNFNKKR